MSDNIPLESPGREKLKAHLAAVMRHKVLCAAVLTLGTLAGVGYALTLSKIYVATTIVMPPRPSSGMSLMSQLGSLANISGIGGAGAANAPDEVYLAIIRSRSMQDHLVKRHDLVSRYEVKDVWDARKQLTVNTKAFSDKKSGLVTVSVEDVDPAFAAKVANDYIEQLRVKTASLALTEAQSKRMYVERQIASVKGALAKAEERFAALKSQHGLSLAELQAESGIRASLELRNAIAEREIQLSVVSSYATSRNPEASRLSSELAALRAQLAKVEGASQSSESVSGEGALTLTAFREMKVLSVTLNALLKQLEIAKMDEARESPFIQVIDEAQAPEKPSKPNRLGIVLVAFCLSLVLGGVLALWADARRRPSV